MPEGDKIEIALSKSKLAKFLIFSVLFIAGGAWMIVTDPQTSNSLFNNTVVKIIAGYGAVLMGSYGIYFFTKKIFDKNPGITIDEKGINDNTTAFKLGLIEWKEISQIYEWTMQVPVGSKQRFVVIGLNNPEELISLQKSLLKRKLMTGNSKSSGSPVHISTNNLKIKHEELLRLLKGELIKYKQ